MDGEQLSIDIGVEANSPQQEAVQCLGMTFATDEERRAYFTEKLREKLRDQQFRQIEGFPIGEDEDILALSDPPYYTACPNPFIEDFINYWNSERDNSSASEGEYHREPFAADVSEGKNDPIYNAHSYHTKVPHKAIMRYILHYTEPGDIVFDGFCGSGMTGVAAQLCGDRATVESLGYRVLIDGTILDEDGKAFSKLGARRAILNDLSPAASFIAYNYNTPVDVTQFEREAKQVLAEVENECGWMYLTLHNPTAEQIEKAVSLLEKSNNPQVDLKNSGLPFGKINYTVWSDVFTCPECTYEMVFWDVAVDEEKGKVRDNLVCGNCNSQLTKRYMGRAWITDYDPAINHLVTQAKQVPVLINYSVGNKRFEKPIDAFDSILFKKIKILKIYPNFPSNRMPEGEESRRNDGIGITHIHHFYTNKNLFTLGYLKLFIEKFTLNSLILLITSVLDRMSKRNRYMPQHRGNRSREVVGPLSGTLYIPNFSLEINPINYTLTQITKIQKAFSFSKKFTSIIQCISSTSCQIANSSIDYIFIDPPFGRNLMYSELNFVYESWLKVLTSNIFEAIVNNVQNKFLKDYQYIMQRCYTEFYRILKPGRWITVEFHNSQNSVWNAIQEAMQEAGFVIADVRTLDKQKGTTKQLSYTSGAVKQDLVISAYKPTKDLEDKFQLKAGTEAACWEFIRNHLQQLPVFVAKNEVAETIAERQNYLLFDRMVAFHIQRGFTVPLSASEFYAGLAQRFVEKDEMYFLPEQVAEYDKKRMTVKEILQLELIVTNEESAVQWLKQQLTKKPQTFQEIHPQFMLSKSAWSKAETPLELSEILEQNFLRYEGKGAIPKQIVSWLKQSSTHRDKIQRIEQTLSPDAIGLETDDTALINAAKDKWYVPNPNQAIDLEKLRLKSLLKEFEEYQQSKQKQLKVFRLEAVRAGFKKAWQEKNYQLIIDVAKKIPETILQEDQKILMWYDQSLTRIGDG